MAYIDYVPEERIDPEDRIPDHDNILQIHGVNSPVLRQHFELYRHLMYGPGPLSRIQRETVAVVVSAENGCRY